MLIANAGLVAGAYEASAQGIEKTFAVSHLAYFLLVELLLPKLRIAAKERGGTRVVLVSSESHRARKKLDLDNVPMTPANYGGLKAYELAKLCNVLHALELDRRESANGVRAFSLHPGNLIWTDIARENLILKMALWIYLPFSPSAARGAATTAFAVAHPDLDGLGGLYLSGRRVRKANILGRNAAAAQALWTHTERLLAEHSG